MTSRYIFNTCSVILLFLYSISVTAQVVEDVVISDQERGYSVEIQFSIPLRYQSHSPDVSGSTLEIQLRPEIVDLTQLSTIFNNRRNISWNKNTGVPIKEIIFDGDILTKPVLIVYFTKAVKYKVKRSADFRSIIIDIEAVKPKRTDKLIKSELSFDPKLTALLERANQAMLSKSYPKAIQLYTKILTEYGGEVRKRAQELLGLAREYNNQLAHAKAEYETYLKNYPKGEGTDRVRQRLTALLTAADNPKDKLKARRRQQDDWDTQFYGSFAQFYYRDETTPENEKSLLLRSDVLNDLDFVARARKGDFDTKLQFIGSYREDLLSDSEGNEFIPSTFSLEAKHSGVGLYTRLGRQSRTTGGVLGRYDGIHTAYDLGSSLTLNGVFGYPVDSSDRTKINKEQEFYGMSFDIYPPSWEGWDFNSFYIKQTNAGITDREAVGGEIHYFDPDQSFFTLVDYDIFYDELNIFLMIINASITDDTAFNWVMDFRKSPLLTTTSAIQGQGVDSLEELLDRFTDDELFRLARDRTADSKSLTLGVTHQLNDNWQYINELTATEFGDTKASGDIEAIQGTEIEYFYSTQLIANSLFYNNDSLLFGLRYADTLNSNLYSLDSNWRVNATNNLRLNPRIRVDYRKDKENKDIRLRAQPFFRVDYRLKRWLKIEFDLGYEWLKEEFEGEPETTSGYFLTIGYRAQF